MKKIILSASLSLFITYANAQYKFEHYNQGIDTINVIENNKTLRMPFAGGLDVPQFSQIDLNNDGIKDLVVFDREGYRLTTFLNKGIANTIQYEYAPQYIKAFPSMSDWMLLVDYNGDGKEDIYTAIPGGLKIYTNTSTPGNLKFDLTFPEIECDYGSLITRLYVNSPDIPAIIDVDNDGDVDILNFGQSIDSSGESIFWFKNMSKERFGTTDSMQFVIGKFCWGKFRESYTNCHVNLNYPVGICGTGGKFTIDMSKEDFDKMQMDRIRDGKHSGSTTTIFDANGDGKLDMIIGDVSCNNLYLLVNSTDNTSPIFTSVLYDYPTNHPINIEIFPAAYELDINNDGLKDLLATINTSNAAENTNHIEAYLNNGNNNLNRYDFSTDNFLISEMVEVGEGAAPSFVDYNNDGLMDIVISNTGYWQGAGVYKTGLALYKNIGTKKLAKYTLITRDWFGFSSLNISNMTPNFGDMDNDGDLDMVCGANDGTLHYFQNNAVNNADMSLQFIPNFFAGIDVGIFSTPFLYDFDADGKLEIIVGERNNNINLFSNTGTISNPVYTLTTDSLYKINLSKYVYYPSGRSSISIQRLRPNDSPRLIVSNANSVVYVFGVANTNYTTDNTVIADSLRLYAGNFGNSSGGFFLSFADLNDDQKPELIAGSPQGGLYLYRNTSLNVGVDQTKKELSLNIYPNPTSNKIFVQMNSSEKFNAVELFDLNGKKVFETNDSNTFLSIDTKEIPNGMYVLRVLGNDAVRNEKVIISK